MKVKVKDVKAEILKGFDNSELDEEEDYNENDHDPDRDGDLRDEDCFLSMWFCAFIFCEPFLLKISRVYTETYFFFPVKCSCPIAQAINV